MLTFSLFCASGHRLVAQPFTMLHAFNGNDGANPMASPILFSNTLYGTTLNGGALANGTIFTINTDGTGFKTLYQFSGGADGGHPRAGLVCWSNTLYGTASSGGAGGSGTIFTIQTNGASFRVLYSFSKLLNRTLDGYQTNLDGAFPQSTLVLHSNKLYGSASSGGVLGEGILFMIGTNGIGFTNIYNFDADRTLTSLSLIDETFYGTVFGNSDPEDGGLIFRIKLDGTGFQALHAFGYGSDGRWPLPYLVARSNLLFGTTQVYADYLGGNVFSMQPNGTVRSLHGFLRASGFTNSEGFAPATSVVFAGDRLIGMNSMGGLSGIGTIFSLDQSGVSFSSLYSFYTTDVLAATNSDGLSPSGLVMANGILYGTAAAGGPAGNGTLFSFGVQPFGPATIITQPQSQTNFPGTTVAFHVGAKTIGPLYYQWFKDAKPLLNRTNTSLTLANIAKLDSGTYSVTVSNLAAVISSQPAALLVIDPPKLALVHSKTNLIVSWPLVGSRFQLQTATNLARPIHWTTVTNFVGTNGSGYYYSVPVSNRTQFFRLLQ